MLDRFLIKLNRFSGWALLVLMILYIISGYGITKQIMDPVLAKYLHERLLAIPLFVFFVLHVAISVSFSLIRWRVFKNLKQAYVYTSILGLILLVLFLWLYLL